MSENIIYYMSLTADKHLINSRATDAAVYTFINRDMFLSFEDRIEENDRSIFSSAVLKKEQHWFFVHLKETHELIALKLRGIEKDSLSFSVGEASVMVNALSEYTDLANSYDALHALYNDIYFIWNLNEDRVILKNAGASDLASRDYTVEEFKQLLMDRVHAGQEDQMKQMLVNFQSGNCRGRKEFDGNLVDNDAKVLKTIIDFCTVGQHDSTTTVVGTIHAERERSAQGNDTLERDGLTGLLNKLAIEKVGREYVAAKDGRKFTLAIMDIDFFKNINDTYGHAMGDAVLRKVGMILQTEIGMNGAVGRFGGDEFLLIINTVEEIKLRMLYSGIHTQISNAFPNKGPSGGRITVSIGCASYPENCTDFDSLFFLADHCLYTAKKKGRDRYIIYTPAKHGTVEEIMRAGFFGEQNGGREDNNPAETIVNMFFRADFGKKQELSSLLKEFAQSMGIQNVMIASGTPLQICRTAGDNAITNAADLSILSRYLREEEVFANLEDFLMISAVTDLGVGANSVKTFLLDHGIESIFLIKFKDIHDQDALLIMTSIGRKQKWNRLHMKYYRLFTCLLQKYEL